MSLRMGNRKLPRIVLHSAEGQFDASTVVQAHAEVLLPLLPEVCTVCVSKKRRDNTDSISSFPHESVRAFFVLF